MQVVFSVSSSVDKSGILNNASLQFPLPAIVTIVIRLCELWLVLFHNIARQVARGGGGVTRQNLSRSVAKSRSFGQSHFRQPSDVEAKCTRYEVERPRICSNFLILWTLFALGRIRLFVYITRKGGGDYSTVTVPCAGVRWVRYSIAALLELHSRYSDLFRPRQLQLTF